MTNASARAGGAGLGTIQIGIADTFHCDEIRLDLVISTSAGGQRAERVATARSPLFELWLRLEE